MSLPDSLQEAPASVLDIFTDVSRIISSSHDPYETLSRTAFLIALRMNVDVCSIYTYNSATEILTLKASFGLAPSAVNQVKMHKSEGLTGLVLEGMVPVFVEDVQNHPRFKPFPNVREHHYSSFLGVPIIEHRKTFGVLVLQGRKPYLFTQEEQQICITIASQISGLIHKAFLLEQLDTEDSAPPIKKADSPLNQRFSGVPIATGFSVAKAIVLQQTDAGEPIRQSLYTIEEEQSFFREALQNTIRDTLGLIDKISDLLGANEAAIFHVHLMFLEDYAFQEKIQRSISQGNSAAWAIYESIQEYLVAFKSIDDPYLREKAVDLKDVGKRLLHHIGHDLIQIVEKTGIIVATQLLPSDIARLDTDKVKGIITATGGVVSHAAIIARSLLIPAVCIEQEELACITDGVPLILDGKSGLVIQHPDSGTLNSFKQQLEQQKNYLLHLEQFRNLPCLTKDGERFSILANVGLESEIEQLNEYGAEGIGLYRSEIYFLSLQEYPTLQEQVAVYSRVLQKIPEKQPLVFRTLDTGADKAVSYMGFSEEENPYLGCRALRHQLMHPEVLKTQIKALLIAAKVHSNVRLIFPMITEISELLCVKKLYKECRQELLDKGHELTHLKIGMMFEVPGSMMLCEHFLPEIDFCSIGSNDLTQYTLAVDRNNSKVAHIYDPLHPAVLKLMDMLIRTAKKFNTPVELCGEMASDPEGCMILIGLGLQTLSMSAPLIPTVKAQLATISLPDAQRLAQNALKASSASEVRAQITQFYEKSSH